MLKHAYCLFYLVMGVAFVGKPALADDVIKKGLPSDYATVPDIKTLQLRLQQDQALAAQGQLDPSTILANSAYIHQASLIGVGVPSRGRPPVRKPLGPPILVATIQGIPIYDVPGSPYAFTADELGLMSLLLSTTSIPAAYFQGIKKIEAVPSASSGTAVTFRLSASGTLIFYLPSLESRSNSSGETSSAFVAMQNALATAVGTSLYRNSSVLSSDERAQISSDAALENSLIAPKQVTPESLFASTFAEWLGAGASGGNSASTLSNALLDAVKGNIRNVPCSVPMGCTTPAPGYSPVLSEVLLAASLFVSQKDHMVALYTLGVKNQTVPYLADPVNLAFYTPSGSFVLQMNSNEVIAVSDATQPGVMDTLNYPVTLPDAVLAAFGI